MSPRRASAVLAPLLLSLSCVLAGCGDAEPDPDREAGQRASQPAWELVAILDATAAGGTVDPEAVPVGSADQQRALTRDLTRPELARRLAEVVAGHETGPGRRLVGAIVAIGCTPPTEVTYDDGLVRPPPSGARVQCLAPVTSLAVLEVPAED